MRCYCWQLAVSVVPVGVLVASGWDTEPVLWSPGLIAIVVYNCVVTTALGYYLWGKVLSLMPAATAGQVLTLTPIGGFMLSLAIFGGTITPDIVASIGRRWLGRRRDRVRRRRALDRQREPKDGAVGLIRRCR
jgi:drug/metabolite transporter (DMT)-like permease